MPTVRASRPSSIAPLIKGQHVRAAGSDLQAGDLLTAAGEPLTPSDLAALGGLGIETVRCHRAPRVAIISTGDEVIPLGRAPSGRASLQQQRALPRAGGAQAGGDHRIASPKRSSRRRRQGA